jgi:nitric oxide dioxygenase
MLSDRARALVKGTVPILREHGETLTRHFYARMFKQNSELKHLFNESNQANGQQQKALAMAVLAYADNIDNPAVLMPVLERVTHKHASIGIRAEHYPIVGKHLLASIREVLGAAAGDELLAAWAAAYQQLADIFIGLEAELYRQAATAEGGWSGWRPFKVGRRVEESAEIASFYLSPVDTAPVPHFKPGQFVSVRGLAGTDGYVQPRQYSLSDAPNGQYLRLSVKRERDGRVSNWMHDTAREGTIVELSPPFGNFTLTSDIEKPLVLISGGVGLTPMVSMLNHVVAEQPERKVVFVHGARHGGVHALSDHVRATARRHPQLSVKIFYETPGEDDRSGEHYDQVGRVDLGAIRDVAIVADADYFICGPVPFMRAQIAALQSAGIAQNRIHYEVFGSDTGVAA